MKRTIVYTLRLTPEVHKRLKELWKREVVINETYKNMSELIDALIDAYYKSKVKLL